MCVGYVCSLWYSWASISGTMVSRCKLAEAHAEVCYRFSGATFSINSV